MKLPRRKKDKPEQQYKRVRCDICSGTGRMLSPEGKWRKCVPCGGTGWVHERR